MLAIVMPRKTTCLLVTCLLLSTGCVKRAGSEPAGIPDVTEDLSPTTPFGAHTQSYAEGSIAPSGDPKDHDRATRDFYDFWKKTYIRPGCNEGELVVESRTKPTNLTVSEAHGYGLIITAYMAGHDPDAKKQFDAMLRYHREHQSRITPGIMAWYQNDSCADVGGDNGATDGDLDIAYALLLADKQWGSCGSVNYREYANWVIKAISQRGVERQGRYVLLGDWVTSDDKAHSNGTRTSDLMGSHFRSFQAASGDPLWGGLMDYSYWMAETVQLGHAPDTGLLPDFIQQAHTETPRPANNGFLEGARDGTYAYNACRIPLRFGTDFLVSGDPRARRITQRLNDFVKRKTGGDPTKLRGGYYLDGKEMVDYETMAFTAPFGVGAMVSPENQTWLDAVWEHTLQRETEHYYEDTLRMLSMIVMSSNWWIPERAEGRACPDSSAG